MPTCTTPGCRNPVRKRGNWDGIALRNWKTTEIFHHFCDRCHETRERDKQRARRSGKHPRKT